MNRLDTRLEKLERTHGVGPLQHKGAFSVTYEGPQDDEKLAAAKAKAEATGMTLVIRNIICPKEQSAHAN